MNSINPRKPWLALAMSLVLPGFGQLYNGEVNKAIWLFLAFALLSVPGIPLVALALPTGAVVPAVAIGLATTLGLWVFGMVDAWRVARYQDGYRIQAWQISGIYLLVLLVCDFVTLPMLIGYVQGHVVASYRIPSMSMEPAVRQGDILFADKRYNCPECKGHVKRGDIDIFVYPNNRTLYYIKRIIALPGDHVEIHNGLVSVNGKPLSVEQSPTATRTETEDGRSWTVLSNNNRSEHDIDQVVPPGHVFVLGDNRTMSKDSRDFGFVPLQDVVGKARQVWLSFGKDGVRWDRLGLRLD